MTYYKAFHLLYLPLALALLPLATTAAWAELEWVEEDGAAVVTIKLTVTPAPEPDPAFKYRLTVKPIDEKPGNAALWYFRALADEGKDFSDYVRENSEKYGEEYDEWNHPSGVPLKDFPKEKASEAFSKFDTEISNLREASLRRNCDWDRGIESIRGPELIAVLLPEIQQMRSITRTLMMGVRLAIAEGRLDDAIDLLRINYRMAQHTSVEPFLVCQLVGVAQANFGNGVLLDLIAMPNSPNMYWALTELPTPLVDLRESLRFEMEIGQRIFPFLIEAETADYAPDQWRQLWGKAMNDIFQLSGSSPVKDRMTPAQFGILGLAMVNYSHAKNSLIAWGFDPQKVEEMPVGQVLAIYSKRVYNKIAQSYEKALVVPYEDAERFQDEAEEIIKQGNILSGGPDREFIPIASLLLPAVSAARSADIRQQRDFAALRVIEALRMHAAENDSELPKRLSDITCVPVPDNPVTNQPFVYYREGKTAVLELPKSDGLHVATNYEITIAP